MGGTSAGMMAFLEVTQDLCSYVIYVGQRERERAIGTGLKIPCWNLSLGSGF